MVKHVAVELSMAEATLRATLTRLLQKLGVSSGAQLPALWRAMTGPARRFSLGRTHTALVFACDLAPRIVAEHLTLAERAILASILEGSSNRAISRQRGTSERTVANQIAALLRKFRVSSRRELNARILAIDAATTRIPVRNRR